MIRKLAFALSVTTICANVNPEYALSKSPTLEKEFDRGISVKRKATVEKNRRTINKRKSTAAKRVEKQRVNAAIRAIQEKARAEIQLEINNKRTTKQKTRAERQATIKKIRAINKQARVEIRKIVVARKKGQTFADLLKRPSLQARVKSPQNTAVLPSIKKIISKPSKKILLPQELSTGQIVKNKPAIKTILLPIVQPKEPQKVFPSKATPVANVPKLSKTVKDVKQEHARKTQPIETRTVVIDVTPAPTPKSIESVNAALPVPPAKNAQMPFIANVPGKDEQKTSSSPTQTFSKALEKKSKVLTLLPRNRSIQKNKPLKMQPVRIAHEHEAPVQIKEIHSLQGVEEALAPTKQLEPSAKKVQTINMREKKEDTNKKENYLDSKLPSIIEQKREIAQPSTPLATSQTEEAQKPALPPIRPAVASANQPNTSYRQTIKKVEERATLPSIVEDKREIAQPLTSLATSQTQATQQTAPQIKPAGASISQPNTSETQTVFISGKPHDIDIKEKHNDKSKKGYYSAFNLPSITEDKKEIAQPFPPSSTSQTQATQQTAPQIKPAEVSTTQPNTSETQTIYISGKRQDIYINEKQTDKSKKGYSSAFNLPTITEDKKEIAQPLTPSSISQTQATQQTAPQVKPAEVSTSQPQPLESNVQTVYVSGKRLDIKVKNKLSASLPVMTENAQVENQTIYIEDVTVKRKSSSKDNRSSEKPLSFSLPEYPRKVPQTPKELERQVDELLAMGDAIHAPEFTKPKKILAVSSSYLRGVLEGEKTPEQEQRRATLKDALEKRNIPEPQQQATQDNTIEELTKLKAALQQYPEADPSTSSPSFLSTIVGLVGTWGAKILEVFKSNTEKAKN